MKTSLPSASLVPARSARLHLIKDQLRNFAQSSSASSGLSRSTAASPTTSGIAKHREVMTGHPHAMASRFGIPNPSLSEGKTNARAALKSPATQASE